MINIQVKKETAVLMATAILCYLEYPKAALKDFKKALKCKKLDKDIKKDIERNAKEYANEIAILEPVVKKLVKGGRKDG